MSPMARPIQLFGSSKRALAACVCLMGLLSLPVAAHLLNMTQAQLVLDPERRSGQLVLDIDLLGTLGSPEAYLAFAKNLGHSDYSPIWSSLVQAIKVEQNHRRLPLSFIQAEPPSPFNTGAFTDPFVWPRIRVTLGVEGYDRLQPLSIRFDRDFIFEEPIAITMSDGHKRLSRWLITSQPSPQFLGRDADASGQMVATAQQTVRFVDSVWVGFHHILPLGVDHLLFVLAVLLGARRVRSAVLLVTAFTLGHSLSLALASFRLVSVPAVWVEPLILLSISGYALMAFYRLNTETPVSAALRPWPVVAIGLLHGLGFAFAFESAFPAVQWPASPIVHLLGFNLGIELAQLLFVIVVFPLLAQLSAKWLLGIAAILVVAPILFALGVL